MNAAGLGEARPEIGMKGFVAHQFFEMIDRQNRIFRAQDTERRRRFEVKDIGRHEPVGEFHRAGPVKRVITLPDNVEIINDARRIVCFRDACA
ncbi:hypothetical protein [Hyphococcus sp.]|uniref:hypothetical protein n=1 Tax=Hyphococcus sp. TaxID=2038636 RepID=UPI0035C6A385